MNGRRHVKSTPDLALGKTMTQLCQVVNLVGHVNCTVIVVVVGTVVVVAIAIVIINV